MRVMALAGALGSAAIVFAQQTAVVDEEVCRYRGELDSRYCDEDRDLVADPPRDPARLRDPGTLTFTYAPLEAPGNYAQILQPFIDHLSACTKRPVLFLPVRSNASQIQDMRMGRLHVAGFSTGATMLAVKSAGAVPFAIKGTAAGPSDYQVVVVVRSNSPFKTLRDLKGKRVAHVLPSSNSGHQAPMALFPAEGLVPEKDYPLVFSGNHDASVSGVLEDRYDAAAVASTVLERMTARGKLKLSDVRVIWRSEPFPTTAFAYANDLHPRVIERLRACFFEYRFSPELTTLFEGADRFLPITYKDAWKTVREVARATESTPLPLPPNKPDKADKADKKK